MLQRFTIFLSITISLYACTTTEPDTTAPTIELIELTPTAQAGLVCGQMEDVVVSLTSEDTIRATFRINDDDKLSQYKLDIHQNFDCHGHGKTETTDWFVLDIVDLSGSEQMVNLVIPVPDDVTTGLYHFSLQVADINGNSAGTVVYSLDVINLSDEIAPTLTVTEPSSESFSAQKGSGINFQGSLSDNQPLGAGNNGRIEVRYRSTSSQTFLDITTVTLDASTSEVYDFNFDATVPITAVSGSYIFEIRAFDGVNNPSNTFQYTVEVL